MTREEAKIFLLQLHTDKQLNKSEHEALRIAIKELEQQPCEDAISRQSVIDVIERWLECSGYNEAERHIRLCKVYYTNPHPSIRNRYVKNERKESVRGMQDDAISRQVVLDKIKEVCFSKEQEWVDFRVSQGSNGQRDLIIKFIEDLPSVQPKPKTGHWTNGDPICPCCGEDKFKDLDADIWSDWQPKYCPNCGAKMG